MSDELNNTNNLTTPSSETMLENEDKKKPPIALKGIGLDELDGLEEGGRYRLRYTDGKEESVTFKFYDEGEAAAAFVARDDNKKIYYHAIMDKDGKLKWRKGAPKKAAEVVEGIDLSTEPEAEKSAAPKPTPATAEAAPVGEKDEEAKKDPAAVAADEKANAIKTIMNFKWREDDGILLSSPKNTKQEIEELKKALFSHGGVNSEIVEQKDVGKFQLIIRDPENLQKAKKVLDGLGVKQSESSPLTVLKNALLEVVSHGPVGREKAGITKDGITKITTTQAWSDAVMPTEIGGNYDYDKAAQGIAGFIGKMSDKMVNSYRFTAPAALGLFAFNAPALGVAVCLIAAGAVAGKIIRTINDSHIEYNVKDSKSETLGLVEAFKGNFDVEAKAANIAGKTLAYGGFALGATGVVAAGITAVGLPLMVAAVATVAGFSAVGYAGMKVKKEYDSFANAITESRKKPATVEK